MYSYYVQKRRFCLEDVASHPVIGTGVIPVLYYGCNVIFNLTFPADTFAAGDIVTLAVDVDKDFINTTPLAISTVTLDEAVTQVEFSVPCRTARFRDIINGKSSMLMAYLQVTRWRNEQDDRVGHVLCDEKCVLCSLVADYGADVKILPKTITIPVPSVSDVGKYLCVGANGEYQLVVGGGGGGGGIQNISVNGNLASVIDHIAYITIAVPTTLAELAEDASHRTVTDTEIANWNGKQNAISSTNKLPYSYLSGTPTIPTALSQLSQDAMYRTVTDTEKSAWNNKSNFSGNYNDLTHKPTIPTVGDGTITLTQGGVTKGTFTTNQSGNATIDFDAGGGGGGTDERPVVEVTNTNAALESSKAYKITATSAVTISLADARAGYESFYTAELITNGGTFTFSGVTLINPIAATAKNYVGIHWDGAAAYLYNYRWEALS